MKSTVFKIHEIQLLKSVKSVIFRNPQFLPKYADFSDFAIMRFRPSTRYGLSFERPKINYSETVLFSFNGLIANKQAQSKKQNKFYVIQIV